MIITANESISACIRRFACACALLLWAAGCGGPAFTDPTPDQLRAVLDEQVVQAGELTFTIDADEIDGFQLDAIVADRKATFASAVIRFDYRYGGRDYRVEGVISYNRSTRDAMIDPYFETNDVQ